MPEPNPPLHYPTFAHDPDSHPADLLATAAFVIRFLAEVSPHLHSDGPDCGLSSSASQGLFNILVAVENTINDAAARL